MPRHHRQRPDLYPRPANDDNLPGVRRDIGRTLAGVLLAVVMMVALVVVLAG
jgi:hypothetical protein